MRLAARPSAQLLYLSLIGFLEAAGTLGQALVAGRRRGLGRGKRQASISVGGW